MIIESSSGYLQINLCINEISYDLPLDLCQPYFLRVTVVIVNNRYFSKISNSSLPRFAFITKLD